MQRWIRYEDDLNEGEAWRMRVEARWERGTGPLTVECAPSRRNGIGVDRTTGASIQ